MNEEDYEIDLLDLAKSILAKWKIIVIITIIFGLLGNIYGFIKETKYLKSINELKETYNLSNNYYSNELVEEIAAIGEESYNKILYVIDEIELLQEIENSNSNFETNKELLNDVGTSYVDFIEYLVIDDNSNKDACINLADSIADGFKSYITNNKINITAIEQIIYIEVLDSSLLDDTKELFDNYLANSYKGTTLRIEYIGNFSYKPNDVAADFALSDLDKMIEIEEQEEEITANYLNEEELDLYNKIVEAKEEDAVIDSNSASIIQFKETIIGAAIGFIIICAIYFCIYIFSNTIKTGDELSSSFGLNNLIDIDNLNKLIMKNKYQNICLCGKNDFNIKSCQIEKAEVMVIVVTPRVSTILEIKEYIIQAKSYNIPIIGYLINK